MSDQGSLFDIGDIPRQATPIPTGPQPQFTQPRLTPAQPPNQAYPGEKSPTINVTAPGTPTFAKSGLGKYVTRNPMSGGKLNGVQFNKPAIMDSLTRASNAYETARYFRNAGMHQAIRHTLNMGPIPSHMNDWIRARKDMEVAQHGINPGHLEGQEAGHPRSEGASYLMGQGG